jgi:hypothetical protein
MEMDFDEAIGLHSKWKRSLRDSLAKNDGSLRPADVGRDDKCEMGVWIYSEGASYSALPEYTNLRYAHARFHSVAGELVAKANSGESIEADIEPCSNSAFSTASAAIVMALMALKKRLSP